MSIPEFPPAPNQVAGDKINVSSKSFITMWLLAVLLGFFGADHFYLNRTKTALIKLFTLGGLGAWWLLDIVLAVLGKQKDSAGIYVTPKKNEQLIAAVLSPFIVLAIVLSNSNPAEEPSGSSTPKPSNSTFETFEMPDLVGLYGDEAVDELKAFGIELSDISFVTQGETGTLDVSTYEVCSHDPAPRAITNSTKVTIEVAKFCSITGEPSASESPSPEPTQSIDEVEYIEVRDAVGLDYQTAQDIWRAQGLIVLPAIDATGQGRWAFIDSNWVVVAQDLSPGSRVEVGTGITASIKKIGE